MSGSSRGIPSSKGANQLSSAFEKGITQGLENLDPGTRAATTVLETIVGLNQTLAAKLGRSPHGDYVACRFYGETLTDLYVEIGVMADLASCFHGHDPKEMTAQQRRVRLDSSSGEDAFMNLQRRLDISTDHSDAYVLVKVDELFGEDRYHIETSKADIQIENNPEFGQQLTAAIVRNVIAYLLPKDQVMTLRAQYGQTVPVDQVLKSSLDLGN